jgi:hypothetical protein
MVASASGYRSSPLGQTPFRPDLPADLARWDLANRLLVEGWSAITLPCLLGDRIGEARAHDPSWWRARPLAADMMGRFAPLLSDEIQTFLTFHGAVLLPDERRSGVLRLLDLKNRFAWSLRNPGLGARGVAGRLRRLWPREV